MKSLTAFIAGDDRVNTVRLTINEDGILSKKAVSAEDFINILLGDLTRSKSGENRSLGGLPKNTFDCYVNDKYKDSFGAIIYSPGIKRIVVLRERGTSQTKVYELPYPNLCFVFQVEKGVSSGYCFAIADDELTWNTEMYLFPFSNVNLGNGKICYGENSTNVESISDLEELITMFYTSPYNGDYYNKSTSTLANLELSTLFERISNSERFPVEILSAKHKTLREILENIKYAKN